MADEKNVSEVDRLNVLVTIMQVEKLAVQIQLLEAQLVVARQSLETAEKHRVLVWADVTKRYGIAPDEAIDGATGAVVARTFG